METCLKKITSVCHSISFLVKIEPKLQKNICNLKNNVSLPLDFRIKKE